MAENGISQSDFIKNEMNFDVDPNDPLTKASLENQPENEWMDILGNNKLRKKVIKPGKTGTRPQRLDLCVVNIVGKLDDGKIVENFEDLKIQLGDVEIVQGLDLALALMDTGEIAEIEVASRFAYGSLGKAPDIPPNSLLHYNVELKSVEQEEEIELMGVSKRQEMGNKKRERGNWWIQRDEPVIAIQCYRRALEYLTPSKSGLGQDDETEETFNDSDLQKLLEDRMKVYNNLALGQMKTEAYDAALESVDTVLRCQPQNEKALFRKGKILHLKGKNATAYATLQQALKVNPRDKMIQQELAVLKKKTEKDAEREKKLYRKMLGNGPEKRDDDVDKSIDEVAKITKARVVWSLIGGTAIAALGVFAYRFIL